MLRGAGMSQNASDRLIEGVFQLLFSCFSLVGWRQRVVRACSSPLISQGLSQSLNFVPSPEDSLSAQEMSGAKDGLQLSPSSFDPENGLDVSQFLCGILFCRNTSRGNLCQTDARAPFPLVSRSNAQARRCLPKGNC